MVRSRRIGAYRNHQDGHSVQICFIHIGPRRYEKARHLEIFPSGGIHEGRFTRIRPVIDSRARSRKKSSDFKIAL